MKISNKFVYAIFISVVVLLIGALVFSVITINDKNDYISKIESQNSENATTIAEGNTKNAELESQLEESKKEKEALNSQLEESNKEKEKLNSELEKSNKENDKLKKDLATLKAKRKAEAEAKAALNAASSSPAPAPSPVQPNNAAKMCYLTFDDGPSENTLKILEILKSYGVKATFFVVNKNANPAYIKNIYDGGHAIGLHSYTHDYGTIYKSIDAYFQDLDLISQTVQSITGIAPNLMRFPGGGSNTVSKKYCSGIMTQLSKMVVEKGYYYFDWNVSSGDANANGLSSTEIVNNVLKGAKNKKNICVLMHDSSAKTTTVDALPSILNGLIEQGFSFGSLTPESPNFRHSVAN